jgi:hypothetical protein
VRYDIKAYVVSVTELKRYLISVKNAIASIDHTITGQDRGCGDFDVWDGDRKIFVP